MEKIGIRSSVKKLDFGSYANTLKYQNALFSQGIKTVDFLCRCNEELLLRLSDISKTGLSDIITGLSLYGLHLNMTTEELEAYSNLPEDAFVDKEVTEDDINKQRMELAYLENEVNNLRYEKSSLEQKVKELHEAHDYENRIDYIIDHTKMCILIDKLDRLVSENNAMSQLVDELRKKRLNDVIPSEDDANHFGFCHELSKIEPIELEADAEDANDIYQIQAVYEPEKHDEPEEVAPELHLNLLSKDDLVHLLDDNPLTLLVHNYKDKVDSYYGLGCHLHNLYDVCSRKEQEFRISLQNEDIFNAIKEALDKHGLSVGMSLAQLEKYQRVYEEYVQEPKTESEADDEIMAAESIAKGVENYDPIKSYISDFEFARLRCIQSCLASQPLFVKWFGTREEKLSMALSDGNKLFDMFRKGVADRARKFFSKGKLTE